jgi:hypothetical protein
VNHTELSYYRSSFSLNPVFVISTNRHLNQPLSQLIVISTNYYLNQPFIISNNSAFKYASIPGRHQNIEKQPCIHPLIPGRRQNKEKQPCIHLSIPRRYQNGEK